MWVFWRTTWTSRLGSGCGLCLHNIPAPCLARSLAWIGGLKSEHFDALLLDWILPDGSGAEVLHWVRDNMGWDMAAVVLRACTDEATVVLLPAPEDRDIWAYFGSLAFPSETLVRQTLEVLADAGRARDR